MPTGADLHSHPLAYARSIKGWSQTTFLAKLRDAGRHRQTVLSTNRHTLSRWENGHQAPDSTTQLCIADLLDVPEERVHRYPWPDWLPKGPLAVTTLEWTTAGAHAALTEAVTTSATDRRQFLVADGPILASAVAHWRIPVDYQLLAPAGQSALTVDLHNAATTSRRTDDIRMIFMDCGGGTLSALAREELSHITRLAGGYHEERAGRRLFGAAAELAQLHGWINFDNGYQAAAQTSYLAALRAAHIADEPLIATNVILSLAMQTAEVGDANDAITLLNSLHTAVAEAATPRVHAIIHADLARAHAKIRRPDGVHDNLEAAVQYLDAATDLDDDPSWCASVDGTTISGHAAAAYLDANEPLKAKTELHKALGAVSQYHAREQAALLIRAAQVNVALDDFGVAERLLDQAKVLLRNRINSHRLNSLVRAIERAIY